MRIAICARSRFFHGRRGECGTGMPTAPGLPLSVTLTGVCDGVDFASPSIKRNLRQGTLGRTWVSGPAHKFSVFGPTVMYFI